MKLSKYNINKIKTQERLILENNIHMWYNMIKKYISTIFQIKLIDEGEVQRTDLNNNAISDDGETIKVFFKYNPNPNLELNSNSIFWNCQFIFGLESSSYQCVTSDGRTAVSGASTEGTQEAIKDLIPKAKSEIISKDNKLFTA